MIVGDTSGIEPPLTVTVSRGFVPYRKTLYSDVSSITYDRQVAKGLLRFYPFFLLLEYF